VGQTPLDPRKAWGLTFWDRGQCRKLIESHRNEGIYTPPDERGTILSPGEIGGVDWGGIAVDVRRQRVFAAVNHLPMLVSADGAQRKPLQSSWGLPCTAPPWGTLASVDMRENAIVWQVPLGSTEGIGPWFAPTRTFGTPHMGGPIATAGDLVFIGAAMDGYFRAFDLENGRELWKHRLPAGGQATPMTYRAGPNHRQFVVIAAGGHAGLGTTRGDYVIAFALPR
jgi:quinoprotein glucose dehydrogenase